MSRRIRYIPEGGALVEVMGRCFQGRHLLRPSEELNALIVGALERARQLYRPQVIAPSFLSNHFHLLNWVPDAECLARFMNHFTSKLAREVCRLHGWSEKVFRVRFSHVLVTTEPAAQIERLKYVLSQGCKEGLVANLADWPGVHAAPAVLSGEPLEGVWIDRTALSAARQRRGPEVSEEEFTEHLTLQLSRLPCWSHLTPEAYRERVAELVDQIEQEAAEHRLRKGKLAVGPEAIQQVDPHSRPKEFQRSIAPLVHAAVQASRRQVIEAYRLFLEAYRRAAEKLREGDESAEFPPGCFPPAGPFIRPPPQPARV